MLDNVRSSKIIGIIASFSSHTLLSIHNSTPPHFPDSPPASSHYSSSQNQNDAVTASPVGEPPPFEPVDDYIRLHHPHIDGMHFQNFLCLADVFAAGRPCDREGNYLDHFAPPPSLPILPEDPWTPFSDCVKFETAEFIYCQNQMPTTEINVLMELWALSLLKYDGSPPFTNHEDLYNTIDSIPHGDVTWQSFNMRYDGEHPANGAPPWMECSYDVWFRNPHTIVQNMIANADFSGGFDFVPYQKYDHKGGRHFQDFMSGEWA
jgi:Plavaka transposase